MLVTSWKSILILLLIPLVLVTIWFRNGLIMGGAEDGLVFYNPSRTLELASTWGEYATGVPYVEVLTRLTLFYPLSFLYEKLHIPNFILQSGIFFVLLAVGMISCYFLTLKLLNRYQFSSSVALISSIFYLLNPFTISQIWGRGLIPPYFEFALLPLSILICLTALQRRQYIFAIFLVLASVFFSTVFEFVAFVITYWIVLFLTFVYYFLFYKQERKDFLFGLTFFALAFLLWVIANLWWLGQYIPVNANHILLDKLGDSEANLNSLIGVSRNFAPDLVVRLLQRSYFSEVGYYGNIYVSMPFQIISLLLPFFVILGLIKVIKVGILRQFRYFVFLFILGLFVSLGANPPFGWLFIWILKNVTILQPFRNPYEKFGLVYALGYSALFALGIVYFFNTRFFQTRFKTWGLVSVLILTCGIFVWPIWTGRIFAGHLDNKIGVPVPSYYQDLNEFLNENSSGFRVFMTPVWSGYIPYYLWKDTIYYGFDPSSHLLNKPTISNLYPLTYYYDFISNIRKYMERIDLAPAIALLRTKYLVDTEDATFIPETERLHYKFLTTLIQPPNDASLVTRSICQNMNVISQGTDAVRLICQIPDNEQNWQGVKYLLLEIKTNTASNLEVSLRDKKDTGNIWEGKAASEYQTDKDIWTNIVIPVDAPTAYSYRNPIDLANISILEILAYPKNLNNTKAINIDLKEVKLDSGREIQTNEFRLIKTFGKLKVYEPNNFKSPPEFGTFSQINLVDDFVMLFQLANQKRDSIDQLGFLLISQNPTKDLSSIAKIGNSKIANKSKISETRYWIEIDQKTDDILLQLSKTFNPQWKVIPMVGKDELNGSLINDIKLLKKSVLPESNHFVVNGYANLWKADGKNGQFAIVFMPQIIENIGLKVSIFCVVIMVGVISIWGVIKFSRFYPRK